MEQDILAGLYVDQSAANAASLRPVPQDRIRAKVDERMSRRDLEGVERVLRYWLEEARAAKDLRGELMIQNELIGHYRKTGEKPKALESETSALLLIEKLNYASSLSAATTYVNIGTARSAFGENDAALTFFSRAREIYESSPNTSDTLLGGLYNNMGLCLAALKRFGEAYALYDLAMARMEKPPGGQLEQAVTLLNRANALESQQGMEQAESEIYALLDRAAALLNGPGFSHDGYFAYVCEKCAPVFEYYGYFSDAEAFKQQAEAIYERA